MRLAPIMVFTVVYVFTCLVGAFFLLADYKPFVALFEYFSGTRGPQLDPERMRTAIVLLLGSPLLLWFGYLVTDHFAEKLALPRTPALRATVSPRLALVTFSALAVIALVSLVRAGAFENLPA